MQDVEQYYSILLLCTKGGKLVYVCMRVRVCTRARALACVETLGGSENKH